MPCSSHFEVLILAFVALGARWRRFRAKDLAPPKTWTVILGLAYSAKLSSLTEI